MAADSGAAYWLIIPTPALILLVHHVATNFCESQGHVWNSWYFDYFVHFGSMPIRFESSTLLGRATLQGLVLFDHLKVLEYLIDSEIISTFAC